MTVAGSDIFAGLDIIVRGNTFDTWIETPS